MFGRKRDDSDLEPEYILDDEYYSTVEDEGKTQRIVWTDYDAGGRLTPHTDDADVCPYCGGFSTCRCD